LSFDEAQEQIERRVPSFVALWHVCFVAFALGLGKPDVFRPLQKALRLILRDNLSGARGRVLNWATKSTCASLYAGALDSVGLSTAFEHELQAFGQDVRLRRACGRLIRSWDEEAVWLPPHELQTSLRIAAQGGWLAGYTIQGALMARLRRAPDEAVDLALDLAGSADERVRYQGLTVASALTHHRVRVVRAAGRLPGNGRSPDLRQESPPAGALGHRDAAPGSGARLPGALAHR
jgi:hypothetical protein